MKKTIIFTLTLLLTFGMAGIAFAEEVPITEQKTILTDAVGVPSTLSLTLSLNGEVVGIVENGQIEYALPFLERLKQDIKLSIKGVGKMNGARMIFNTVIEEEVIEELEEELLEEEKIVKEIIKELEEEQIIEMPIEEMNNEKDTIMPEEENDTVESKVEGQKVAEMPNTEENTTEEVNMPDDANVTKENTSPTTENDKPNTENTNPTAENESLGVEKVNDATENESSDVENDKP